MVNQDSDDYELMPSNELDDLRREVSSLKKNSLTEGDKARVLIESMDRMTISLNRLITILDDAQKDIIDEYQESKPAEKLNQLLEQNEMIAKALIAISENLSGTSSTSGSRNPLPTSNYSDVSTVPSQNMSLQNMQQNRQQNIPTNNIRSVLPIDSPYDNSQNQQYQQYQQYNQPPQFPPPSQSPYNQQMSMPTGSAPMNSLDNFPSMDDIPPLDSPPPLAPKKKFLGIM